MQNKNNRGGLAAILNESPLILTVIAVGLLFLLITGLRGCSKSDPKTPVETKPPVVTTPAPIETTAQPDTQSAERETPSQRAETEPPAPSAETETPAQPTAPVSTEAPTTEAPDDYPTGFTTVDESYFDDALFIGNSLTDGLCLYDPVGSAKHFSAASATIFGIMDMNDEFYGYYGLRALLQGETFGKIYIKLGINECGYDTDQFINQYQSVLNEIRSYQPNALIYIQAILYVTQKHETNNPVFATAGIMEKNARLKQLAEENGCYFLDLTEVYNDGTNHMPADWTGDGCHPKASCYKYWHQYLLEHAIVDAAHPWQSAAN